MIQTPSAGGWDGPSIAVLCVSASAALIAGASTIVSYLAFRSQTDPDVIVYAQPDKGRPSIINLIIESIGKASAEDIAFHWTGKLPSRAFGLKINGVDSSEVMEEGPLVHGISSLPPGGKRVITWGQYGGLHDALDGEAMEITIWFRSKRRIFGGRRRHENTCSVDIHSFEATDASDRNWDKKTAENLGQLRTTIESESGKWMQRLNAKREEGTSDQDAGPSDFATSDGTSGGEADGN